MHAIHILNSNFEALDTILVDLNLVFSWALPDHPAIQADQRYMSWI